jgi:oligoribonuclease NrnB/cAMP/cGMP phosphodiesterase (DHH superfamily)
MSKATIMYHGVDLDGFTSAAIAYRALRLEKFEKEDITFMPVNYGWEIDWEKLEGVTRLVIVDFTFDTREEWLKVLELVGDPERIDWIDHHEVNYQAAINYDPRMAVIPGVRCASNAAILHTWQYFFQGHNPHELIIALNDYDCWNQMSYLGWEEKVLPIQMGMRLKNWDPGSSREVLMEWNHILMDDGYATCTMSDALEAGQIIRKYQEQQWANVDRRRMYEVNFEGFNAIAVNSSHKSSQLFGEESLEKYDLCICYCYSSTQNLFKLSIYSHEDKDHIHCGMIAQRHGGGGHKGAAGFRLSVQDWMHWFTKGIGAFSCDWCDAHLEAEQRHGGKDWDMADFLSKSLPTAAAELRRREAKIYNLKTQLKAFNDRQEVSDE